MANTAEQNISQVQAMNTSYLLKRFIPYFSKYKFILLFDLACASATTVCELVLPLIVRYLTGIASTDIPSLTVKTILNVGIFYMVLRIIDAAANYYMNNTGHVMGAKIETDMRKDLFDHLQKLSYTFYDETKVGQIMSRMTSDLFDVTEFAHHCPEEFFIAALKIGVSFLILLTVNVPLTLIVFAILPVMIVCTVTFRKKMRSASKASRQQVGEINSQVEDSLLGIRVVKSFANEDIETEKFKSGNHLFLDIKKISYKYMAAFHSTVRIFHGIMYITVVILGSLFMLHRQITPSDFTAYILYVNTLLQSIRRIVEFTEQFQRGMTGIERFIEIMDVPVTIQDIPNANTLTNVNGDIKFNNVAFKYDDNKESVLSNINLHILSGDNIAIVGPSGSGKTTLCNLIPRFYDVTDGSITIDGNDIRNLTLSSLRNNIGVVQQDVYLFSGSIYENIAYGKQNASKKEIMEAAKKAGAHEFITKLPNGYDSYVGERGVKLSGGQKQRISIARVFLKNPPILILDEATSSLDNESELIVQQSLEKLAKGRTTLTIAHRLTTIVGAKTILVLTEDGIVEQGNHSELIDKKGVYYNLYKMYQQAI